MEKYVEKYNIVKDNNFLSKFFKLITQFIFRAYDKENLVDYSKLLKEEKCSNFILIRILAHKDDYKMKTFDLLDKGEFIFNSGSEDCYMNVIGELMDKKNKKVYCPITISEKETFHDNSIYESDKIIYLTKTSMIKEAVEKKLKEFIDKNYEFCIGVRFTHLQYSNTSYFNMGKVKIIGEPELNKVDIKKYNHKIKFQLEEKISNELLQYKTLLE